MSEVVALLEDALLDLRAAQTDPVSRKTARFLFGVRESIGAALRVYRAEQAMSEDEARL